MAQRSCQDWKVTITKTFARMSFTGGKLEARFFCSGNFDGRSDLWPISPPSTCQLPYPGIPLGGDPNIDIPEYNGKMGPVGTTESLEYRRGSLGWRLELCARVAVQRVSVSNFPAFTYVVESVEEHEIQDLTDL